MKINEPITQTEEVLDEDSLLISRTDLKGAISFCNEEFIRISGFSQHELEGSNHNIVRHPEMPPEAFGDLWNTVKQGESWKGVVKNRCKNGSFYWVYAHVTPVIENGQINGYMSVRTKPTQQQVREASQLYEQVNHGQAKLQPTIPNQSFNLKRLLRDKKAILGLAAISVVAQVSTIFFPHGSLLGTGLSIAGIILMLSTILGFYLRESRVGDESNKSYQEIVEKLNYVLGQSKKAAGRISQGVQELEQRNLALQARNESQIASVVETQAAIKSLAEQVNSSTSAAEKAAKTSEQSSEFAIEGSNVMRSTIGAMDTISNGSSDIADIIGLIDDIAFQTNLLALNASVEAAHAGDSGRGFSVVATEVRALSQRTTEAALQIKNLISNSGKQVSEGQDLVQKSDEQLIKIVDAAKVVNELIGRISNQSSAQNVSISEVNIAMGELEKMTMENTDLVDQTRSASAFLSMQSSSLDELLKFFEVDESSSHTQH